MTGFGFSLGIRARRVAVAAVIEALDPFAASQPVTAAYSLRRVRAGYAGNALQVRDSGNTLRTLGFNADGTLNTTGISGYGDGVTFTVATWYDQTGGTAHNFTSTTRPALVFPNAPTDYLNPYIDFTAKTQNMVTATGAEFLNVGGTANVSVFAVAGVYGWTSAGTHPRGPAVYNSAGTYLLGYGTTSGGVLVTSAAGTTGETVLYSKEGELLVDASTPDTTRRRVWWWNQKGAVVSGGADVRQLFTDRAHGVAASGAVRLVLGNRGDQAQSHNGPVREVVIFNNAGALSDLECQRIAIGQYQSWSGVSEARFPDRFLLVLSGQSLAQYQTVDNVSGDGTTVGSNSYVRVFVPAMQSGLALSTSPLREFAGYASNTAIGGSSIVKRIDGGQNKNWWDADTGTPGPSLTSWVTNIALGNPGKKYRRIVIGWDQGQAEAYWWAANSGDTTIAAEWKAQTKLVWAYMRSILGYDCPIVIEPLGNQTGAQPQMDALRVIQTELAAEVPGVTISNETTDLQLQDTVHFSSSLKGPNQSANGFDLAATRWAAKISAAMLAQAVPS